MTIYTFDGDKYQISRDDETRSVTAKRHGEDWSVGAAQFLGNKMLHSMLDRIDGYDSMLAGMPTSTELSALLPGVYYMDPPDGGNVSLLEQLRRMSEDAAKWRQQLGHDPINMVLHCPACGLQHIDEPEKDAHAHSDGTETQWDNPPHRSHLCHGCGHIWRPADVPTNGVAAVQTTGKKDSPLVTVALRVREVVLSEVMIDFDRVGTAGPFPIIDGRVKLPEVTTGDLVYRLQRAAPTSAQPSDALLAAYTDLLTYVLQHDMHNRTTPRVIDIAYTAFMQAKSPNTEDGGPSDWYNDTKPMIEVAIDKLRRDLMEDRAAKNNAALTTAALDVLVERNRQVSKGHTCEIDDMRVNDDLAAVAATLIMPEAARDWDASSTGYGDTLKTALMPVDWGVYNLEMDRRAQLVRGAAMTIAEIERLDRAALKKGGAA